MISSQQQQKSVKSVAKEHLWSQRRAPRIGCFPRRGSFRSPNLSKTNPDGHFTMSLSLGDLVQKSKRKDDERRASANHYVS